MYIGFFGDIFNYSNFFTQTIKDFGTHFHTLFYLINEQDGINKYSGKFLIINNRAGWNKRAEGANFENLIKRAGGKYWKYEGEICQNNKKSKIYTYCINAHASFR